MKKLVKNNTSVKDNDAGRKVVTDGIIKYKVVWALPVT